MPAKVDPNTCIGCQTCIGACPVKAIILNAENKAEVDPVKCTDCELCVEACPLDAISMAGARVPAEATAEPAGPSETESTSGCSTCPGCGK